VPDAVVTSLQSTLAPDETARAARIRRTQDRDRYVAARGVLRAILGRYLDIEPRRVRFEYNTHGKPSVKLPVAPGSCTVSFNVSHSHGMALFAIAGERAVGMDVELVRPEVAMQNIPEHFFSRDEAAALRSLPVDDQPLAFYQVWTGKEAVAKARGEGIKRSLADIEVSLAPGQPPRLLRLAGGPDQAARWSLRSYYPAAGYVAALAVESHGWRLATWDWQW